MRMRRGFTLIELLVVIAVIMILIALTMPVIMKAIYSAEKTQCLNNIRQIVSGMHQYGINNQRMFPPHRSYDCPHWNDWASQGLHPTYVAEIETFYCPISYERYNPQRYWNKPGGERWDYVWGYQYMGNAHMISSATFFPDVSVVPKDGMRSPGELALVQDNVWHSVSGGHYNGAHPCRSIDPRPPVDVNVVYVDGHGENRKFKDLPLRCALGSSSYFYWP